MHYRSSFCIKKKYSILILLFICLHANAKIHYVKTEYGGKDKNHSEYEHCLYKIFTTDFQDGDTIMFDEDVQTIIIEQNLERYEKENITISGNGVTIRSVNAAYSFQFDSSPYSPDSLILENIHFVNVSIKSNGEIPYISIKNCSFSAETSHVTLDCIGAKTNRAANGSLHRFTGCSFTGKNGYTVSIKEKIASESTMGLSLQFISCTFANEEVVNRFIYPVNSIANHQKECIFTNCVLMNPLSSEANPCIETYQITSNGYNVMQGSAKTTEEIRWKGTDRIQTGDIQPLTLEEDIYKVTYAGGSGAAYRNLPAYPESYPELAGISFPEKDLSGTKIDYTRNTHSGAWQSVYLAPGEEETEDDQTITDIVLNLSGENPLYTDTTYTLSARVYPNGTTKELQWSSTSEEVELHPVTTTSATLFISGFTQDTTVTLTVSVEEYSKDYTFQVKPYIHVEKVVMSSDTLRTVYNYPVSLSATVYPATANNPALTWKLSKEESATLTKLEENKYEIMGSAPDTVKVLVTAEDRGVTGECVVIFTDGEYTHGVFLLNEDQYGTYAGSINYLDEEGQWHYRLFQKMNDNQTLGMTTQFGTIYGGKLYVVPKQGNTDIIDAVTMKSTGKYSYSAYSGDGRSFVGVDENTGYIATSAGIYKVALGGDTSGSYTEIKNTGSSGDVYASQVGTMRRVGNRVFAVQQDAGLVVINALTHKIETTLTGYNYATLTQSKDGYLWTGTSLTETGEEDDEEFDENQTGNNIMVRINPWTLETEEITLPTGINGPPAAWGAWRFDPVWASTKKNELYWKDGSTKIIRYDIDKREAAVIFDLSGHASPVDSPWIIYGTGFGIHPETGELYVIAGTYSITGSTNDRVNWKMIQVDPEQVNTENPHDETLWTHHELEEKHYWFPAMPIFPDKYAPEFTGKLNSILTLSGDTAIYLGDKVTDRDNMDAAIVKSVIAGDWDHLLDISINRDTLYISPIVAVNSAETYFTLKANSNGQIITTNIQVKVSATNVIENPFRINRDTVRIAVGQIAELSLTAPEAYPNATWRSSNIKYAMVDGGAVIGIAKGTAQIIAEEKSRNKADTCIVIVGDSSEEIALNTSQFFMNARETFEIKIEKLAAGLDKNAAVWTTSDASVADVTAAGKVMAIAPGSAIITATLGSYLATCTITVRDVSVEAGTGEVGDHMAKITFPKIASASYYLLHVYQKTSAGSQLVVTLEVDPDKMVDETYSLRSSSNQVSVTLSSLNSGTQYEVQVQAMRKSADKVEVISNLTTTFRTTGLPTATADDQLTPTPPAVIYHNGILQLYHLEGYTCQLISIHGQILEQFRCTGMEESRHLHLASGVYILNAYTPNDRQAFKFRVP